jgi:hypothetical protein
VNQPRRAGLPQAHPDRLGLLSRLRRRDPAVCSWCSGRGDADGPQAYVCTDREDETMVRVVSANPGPLITPGPQVQTSKKKLQKKRFTAPCHDARWLRTYGRRLWDGDAQAVSVCRTPVPSVPVDDAFSTIMRVAALKGRHARDTGRTACLAVLVDIGCLGR